MAAGGGGPGVDFGEGAEGGLEVVGDVVVFVAGPEAVEDAEEGVWGQGADGEGFFGVGDEEVAAAGGVEGGGDLGGAVAVGVGFEDGGCGLGGGWRGGGEF